MEYSMSSKYYHDEGLRPASVFESLPNEKRSIHRMSVGEMGEELHTTNPSILIDSLPIDDVNNDKTTNDDNKNMLQDSTKMEGYPYHVVDDSMEKSLHHFANGNGNGKNKNEEKVQFVEFEKDSTDSNQSISDILQEDGKDDMDMNKEKEIHTKVLFKVKSIEEQDGKKGEDNKNNNHHNHNHHDDEEEEEEVSASYFYYQRMDRTNHENASPSTSLPDFLPNDNTIYYNNNNDLSAFAKLQQLGSNLDLSKEISNSSGSIFVAVLIIIISQFLIALISIYNFSSLRKRAAASVSQGEPYLISTNRARFLIELGHKIEFRRKFQHFSSGMLIFYLYEYFVTDSVLASIGLAGGTLFLYVFTWFRSSNDYIASIYLKIFGSILRNNEKNVNVLPAAFYFIFGCTIVVLFYRKVIALAAILALAVGDPFAAAIGTLFRSDKAHQFLNVEENDYNVYGHLTSKNSTYTTTASGSERKYSTTSKISHTTRSGKIFNSMTSKQQKREEIQRRRSDSMSERDLNGLIDNSSPYFNYKIPERFQGYNFGKKSIMGSSACFFASFIVIFWYLILFRVEYQIQSELGSPGRNQYISMLNETHQNFIIAGIGALGATIGEGISNKIAIDDNLLLPITTAYFLSFVL